MSLSAMLTFNLNYLYPIPCYMVLCLQACPAALYFMDTNLSQGGGKPAFLIWLGDECPASPHPQLCEFCARHSCRALLPPQRKVIPHNYTQHRSSLSTPHPILYFCIKTRMFVFSAPHCKDEYFLFQSDSLKCSYEYLYVFLLDWVFVSFISSSSSFFIYFLSLPEQ